MRRWRWPVAAVVGILVLGTGGYAVAQTRESDPSYRTAVARVGDVERTLDLSGTVTAAGRRDLTFGASGSVARVAVSAGRRVQSGQVLARLDPTSFDAAVTSAEATLARAEAQLAADEDAQADAVSDSATSASTRPDGPTSGSDTPRGETPKGETPSAGTDPALQELLAQLAGQQQAVTEAQSAASGAIEDARAALAAQTEACRAQPDPDPTPAPSPNGSTEDPGPEDEGGGPGPDTDSDSESGSVSAECTQALATVQAAQDLVAQKQDGLQSALAALGATLGQAVTEVSKPSQDQPSAQTQSPTQSQGAPASSEESATPTSDEETPQGSADGGGTVTAARLAQDQADIDTARARLTQARAEREAATLRAPYDGRILRSDIAKGDLVSATDPAFVLVGSGETTVTTTASTAQVPSLRRGQRVTVLPAGWTSPLTGTVSAIGLLPDSDGVFPVTVTVSSTKAVAEGTTASVSIVTGSVRDAVTVPASALSRTSDRATLQVLAGGAVKQTTVGVGVVGTRRVSITEGLAVGATVVLADLDASVPSGNANEGARFGGRGEVRMGPGGGGPGTATFNGPPGG